MNAPNVLLVTADQLRRDGLGCYGDPVTQTPSFDRLAAEGVRFTGCISNHPACSPWRATLQTGQYAHVHRVMRNNLPIDTTLPTLADAFNAAGYHTAFYGKAHWWNCGKPGFYTEEPRLRFAEWGGFNRGHYHWDAPDFDDEGNLTHAYAGRYAPEVETDKAIDFFKRRHGKPWLLQLNWGPPHNATMDDEYADNANRERMKRLNTSLGFGIAEKIMDSRSDDDPEIVGHFPQYLSGKLVPQQYLDRYDIGDFPDRPDIAASDRTLVAHMRKEYSAMTTSIDDQMGRLLRALDETGQASNTIVLFTSDHGDYLGNLGRHRGKGGPFQASWRTPLIVRAPGCDPGRTSNALIAGIDLLPTVCAMAGIPRDRSRLPGVDFSSRLRREAPSQEEVMVGLGNYRSLVTPEWSYAAHLLSDHLEPWHLFRHADDPWDLNDLVDTEAEIRNRLHRRLLARLQEIRDPLLSAKTVGGKPVI